MAVLKLSKRTIDALHPREKAYIAFDADLRGFGLRVMPSGAKSWVVEYRPHGGGRGVDKKRVTLGSLGALTPDQARKAAADMLAAVRLGADPAGDKAARRAAVTVDTLLEQFDNEYVATMVKPSTAVSHRIAIEQLRGAHGSLKADALTRSQIAVLHGRMAVRPYAANRAVAVWSKAFTWGAARGLIAEGINPAKGVGKYREQNRERYLTRAELAALGDALRLAETQGLPYLVDETSPKAKHAPKPENRKRKLDLYATAAIRLLILTGARLREILDLKWKEVDFERGIAFLPDSKTGAKPLYLSAAALAVVSDLPRIEGNPHIIAGAKDGAARSDLKKPWAAVAGYAGLSGVRLHDLRHSFASFGAGASLGLPIIGKLLGHSQASTTHRYAHLDADPLRRAAEAIGATISAAMDGKKGADIVPFAVTKN